jgi:hypothetical protein
VPVLWEDDGDGKYYIYSRLPYDELTAPGTLDRIERFFAENVNRFISVLRPRLERIVKQL